MVKSNKVRPDYSNALIHLTRRRKGELPLTLETKCFDPDPDKGVSAFEVLKEIVSSGAIEPSTPNVGYIKGRHKATCFSEVPFSGLKYLLNDSDKYEPYGLICSKPEVYTLGGRPVIYLPDDEISWIPKEELWRVVRFEPHRDIDYTFEREWRVPSKVELTSFGGFYALVRTRSEAKEIEKIAKDKNLDLVDAFIFNHLVEMF